MSEHSFPTEKQIEDALAAIETRPNITDIYYVGCGASYSIMLPNQYAIDRLSNTLTGTALNSAEFVKRNPARLGENALVILCSMAGKTPETVAAAKFAYASGALTITTTNIPGSPLDEAVDHTIYFNYKPETCEVDHMGAVLAKLTFGILVQREKNEIAAKVLKAIPEMPGLVSKAVEQHADRILAFAEAHKRDSVINIMGSGTNFSIAYQFAHTIYQEMLWINSAPIHTNEYFHGPFEITDFDVPFIVMRSIGATKDLDDRAIEFAKQYSKKVTVLDSEELGLGVFSDDIVEYLEHLMFNPLMRNYANRLGYTRGHPLTVRRYMWQFDY